MARASLEIVHVLRKTADRLGYSKSYPWGRMRLSNCVLLALEVMNLRKGDVHWREQFRDYCPSSKYTIDELISDMLAFGFDRDDLIHLEKLSDKRVLQNIPEHERNLALNSKKDVVIYLKAWADLVERDLIAHIMLPSYLSKEETIL
jgi:hypothetical protein